MAYRFISPRIIFCLTKSCDVAGTCAGIAMIIDPWEPHKWSVVVGILILVFFLMQYLLTKRVVVDPSGIEVMNIFTNAKIAYAEVISAGQLPFLGPKMGLITTTRRSLRKYILFIIDPTMDFFNMNVHEVIDYINTRAQAASDEE